MRLRHGSQRTLHLVKIVLFFMKRLCQSLASTAFISLSIAGINAATTRIYNIFNVRKY
jgi:hypothetical protein